MRKVFLFLSFVCALPTAAQEYKLWYDKPASRWLEALPVGNSQMGAMIYGGTDTEEIQLNEETFWSGSPHDNDSPAAKAHLQEVRDSIFAGKEEAAHKIIDQYFFKGPHGMRFLPVGSVKLSLGHKDVTNYRRELNIGTALNTTSCLCLVGRPCRHRTTDSQQEGRPVVWSYLRKSFGKQGRYGRWPPDGYR